MSSNEDNNYPSLDDEDFGDVDENNSDVEDNRIETPSSSENKSRSKVVELWPLMVQDLLRDEDEDDETKAPLVPAEILPDKPQVLSQGIQHGQQIYNKQMMSYGANEAAQQNISQNEKNKLQMIEFNGWRILQRINKDGAYCLWKHKNTFYYRSARGNEIHKGNIREISEIIGGFLNKPIKIISVQDLAKNKTLQTNTLEQYILTSQILVIEGEVFDPKEREFFDRESVLYKNFYPYTKYLEKRLITQQRDLGYYDCFIVDFLEAMTSESTEEDSKKLLTVTIIEWMSHYFQTMDASNIALVLDGNKDITEDIFWKKVIQPIFGYEPYTVTIDDAMLKRPIHEILKDSVFFHLGDFTPSDENVKKINQILRAVLIDRYTVIESNPMKRIPVHGQLLITSNTTLWRHMKKYHSRFEYINVQDEEGIINVLNTEGIIELELQFTDKEIDAFSDVLNRFNRNKEKRSTVVYKVPKVDTTKPVEDAIKEFIHAIKNHCNGIGYFSKIKDADIDLYDELIHNFDEGMIARQLLLDYFNIIYPESPFTNNKSFLEALKKEDDFFSSNIDKNAQHNKKKRFKILCTKHS